MRRWLDLAVATPRSLELALNASLNAEPKSSSPPAADAASLQGESASGQPTSPSPAHDAGAPRVYQFAATRRQRLQPPRTLCETALFDPKYAIPIIALEPEVYPAFIGCYVMGRHHTGKELQPVVIQGTTEFP